MFEVVEATGSLCIGFSMSGFVSVGPDLSRVEADGAAMFVVVGMAGSLLSRL